MRARARSPGPAFLLAAIPVAALCVMTARGAAQTDWRMLLGARENREGHAMAWDPVRSRTMVFGGKGYNVTWTDTAHWDGARWTKANPAIEPPKRYSHAMATDLARGRVVLFGGLDIATGTETTMGDTWEWDGATWIQRSPTNAPSPRSSTAMTYDLARARVVLFGGMGPRTFLSGPVFADTWEWDGANWALRTPAVSPTARYGHRLAYDVTRNRTVLFGGATNDTWEWNGTTWTAVAQTSPTPPARRLFGMTFDLVRNRTLLFGGTGSGATLPRDLWAFDGNAWQILPHATAVVPTAQRACDLSYDFARGRSVVHGGDGPSAETLEWNGSDWVTLTPPGLIGAALALDPGTGTGIVFGGDRLGGFGFVADTWEWRAGAFQLLQPATRPVARQYHAMAADSARGQIVLFGGVLGQSPLGDTWLWDGQIGNWIAPTVGVSPPARSAHGMIFDSIRQEVVLFGGQANNVMLGDTWVWDGTAWHARTPAMQPSPRLGVGFAFDAARGRGVLYGSLVNGSDLTWEWDGTNWLQQSPLHTPTGLNASFLAYDPARRRAVLHDGFGLWEWDGVDWIERLPAAPLPYGGGLGAYDVGAGRMLYVGGGNGQSLSTAIWSYGAVAPATIAPFGTGCAGSAGTPVLRADNGSLPWLGDTLALAVEPVAANAPVLLAIGFSNTTFGGVSLPVPLDAIGMTGCSLLVSIDEQRLAFSNGARADFALLVPTTTALTGLQFFAQAAVADAAANPAGIVASNALAGQLGGK